MCGSTRCPRISLGRSSAGASCARFAASQAPSTLHRIGTTCRRGPRRSHRDGGCVDARPAETGGITDLSIHRQLTVAGPFFRKTARRERFAMTELEQLGLISSHIEEALQAAEQGSLLHRLLEMATQEVCER